MKIKQLISIVALGATVILVSGCNGPYKNQAVKDAEEIFGQAETNPLVLQYAPKELERAREVLMKATKAEQESDMTSLAYVAQTKAQTAVAVAERKKAVASMEELSREKDQERLKARERELQREQQAKAAALEEKEAALRAREAALASAEALKASTAALQKELADLQAKKTERGMVMTLGDVLFASGKSKLLPGAMGTIDRLATFLGEYPDKTVLVEGHTDNVGRDSFNQELSEQRASAVRAALMHRGIAGSRVETLGMGETQPIADNSTDAGRLKNRRVEIVIRD